jgi:hypothetical protein
MSMIRRRPLLAVIALALACGATLTGGMVTALTADQTLGGDRAAVTPELGGPGAPPRPTSGGTGAVGGGTGGAGGTADADQVAPLRRVVPPDLLAVATRPISAAGARRIAKLGWVRDVIVVDGGAVQLQGRKLNAFAVEPSRFRSWTPPGTAKKTDLWTALTQDRFVVSGTAMRTLGLREGLSYPIVAKTVPRVTMGGSGALGLPGVDMLVSRTTGTRLGLIPGLAVMVNAPGADLPKLTGHLQRILGADAQVLNLHERRYQVSGGRRPGSYLDLYHQAAGTCPGLSWTVLAAIGQIESSHGRNAGPSSAGALGPMQFLPATWRAYGVDGDGDHRADIMNPYDAVPSAARYLCANGAGRGGQALYNAVFRYNHADWYVQSVLNLARAYARRY